MGVLAMRRLGPAVMGKVVAPAAPTGLTATAISSTRIDLAWTDAATTETEYRVYRSTDGVTYALLATIAASSTAYSNTGLAMFTRYWYKVAAANAAGETLSAAADATTLLLLRDEFTTDRASGAVNGTAAEPGPGTRTVIQTSGTVALNGGKAIVTGYTGSFSDPVLHYGTVTRAAGLALYALLNGAAAANAVFGFNAAVNNWNLTATRWTNSGARTRPANIDTDALAATNQTTLTVLRSAGAFYVINVTGVWKLLWTEIVGTSASLYVGAANYANVLDIDNLRLFQMGAPWTDDFGIATQRLSGARAPGDTFAHEGNCLIECVVGTVPAALQIELRFRVQDATNYWQVTVDSTGALDLDEVVAGGVTQRGTAAGVVADGDRIVIVADGTTIKVFEASTLRITYTSAANFATATAGELETEGTGGAVTDIVTWPRTISGAALTELARFTA